MRWLSLLAVLVSALALADTAVYRWVDANGVVHYSDQPHPGAVKVDLGAPQVIDFKAPAPLTMTPPPITVVRPALAPQQYVLRILAPADGTTLRPINNQVGVRVAVAPPLGGNSELQYLLDGQAVSAPTTATTLLLQQVYRGTHTLTVTALGPDGEAAGSVSSTFYVHQHSALFNRKKPGPVGGGG
ncbi:MAG: DUF4124 domain-containing protein [Gammaproteobacteria bacterium]